MATTPQRSYTAACPGCGAPVAFRSAQSTHAVCSYCRSTVVREGATVARVGKMAELFDDHSPLQLQARGKYGEREFSVVGRLQYRGDSGTWTEWNCLFSDGETGWLAEDNGSYVMAFAVDANREIPEADRFRVGATTAIGGKSYQVTGNEQVALISAEGELPKLPPVDARFPVVELRSADNEVLALDYGATPPAATRGRPVALEELAFSGLRGESTKLEGGLQFSCPHCGAPVTPRFDSSKSITCPACKSIIDLTRGVAGAVGFAEQGEAVEPLIPLGTVAQFQGVHWQVVGYQNRVGTEPDDPDEHFGWDEYLLYNRKRGFTFLLDTTEGWSVAKPVTGAPELSRDLTTASYLGTQYKQQYAYKAQVNFAEGEFYWPVERGQVTFNRDYASGNKLLAMEETPRERTWSLGSKVDAAEVAKAFGIKNKELLKRGDSGPVAPGKAGMGCGCATLVVIVLVILIFIAILDAMDDDRTGGSGYSGSRSGGSYSGGSHK
ncbi:MAG TPA: DUF4178 domain-containing protein [Ramlibacter sp.]|nr:DUF4178 domain-containing protein [Ramlibacter sp.]